MCIDFKWERYNQINLEIQMRVHFDRKNYTIAMNCFVQLEDEALKIAKEVATIQNGLKKGILKNKTDSLIERTTNVKPESRLIYALSLFRYGIENTCLQAIRKGEQNFKDAKQRLEMDSILPRARHLYYEAEAIYNKFVGIMDRARMTEICTELQNEGC